MFALKVTMPKFTIYSLAVSSDLEQFVGRHAIVIPRTGYRHMRIGSNVKYGYIGYFPFLHNRTTRKAYAVAPELEVTGEAPLGFVIDTHDDKVYVKR
jgi:hypothetical protein